MTRTHFSVIDLTDMSSKPITRLLQPASGPDHRPAWHNGIALRIGHRLFVWTRSV